MMKRVLFSVILLSTIMTNSFAQNPFLKAYKTPYETPPFNKIKNEHYTPAFEQGMKEQKAEIDAIVRVRSVPTFENTLRKIGRVTVSRCFCILCSIRCREQ